MPMSKLELRERLLTARRAVNPAEQKAAAENLKRNALQLSYFAQASKLALYWPHDAEINPLPLLYEALAQHKTCFLPVLRLQLKQALAFAVYELETPLIVNRYGIHEPEISYTSLVEPSDLDIIFLPLVGFDARGSRLGRGGGFYDATFAELAKTTKIKWPKLVGLAYACQEVESIPTDSWDWQLDAVVTEKQVFDLNSA
jgi:5-formyltetrahydrofolate cyclo-ligase